MSRPAGREPALLRSLLGPDFRPAHATCRRLPGVVRIAVVGDSYAYGLGVAEAEAIPAQVQAVLNSRRGPTLHEVVSLGRPGMNLVDEWALLRQLAPHVDWDLVVLIVSSDDAHPLTRQELATQTSEWREAWSRQWRDEEVLGHFAAVVGAIVEQERQAGRRPAFAFYEPGASAGAGPLVVVERLCRGLGVPFLDLVTPFATFAPELLRVSKADGHPSPLAHRIAAVELAGFLDDILRPHRRARGSPRTAARHLRRLDAIDDRDGGGAALAYRHCAVLASLGRVDAATAVAAERVRRLHNHHLRLWRFASPLRIRRSQLADLCADIHRLERHLRLYRLGLRGGAEALAATSQLEGLHTLAARLAAAVPGLTTRAPATARGRSAGPLAGRMLRLRRALALQAATMAPIAAELHGLCRAVQALSADLPVAWSATAAAVADAVGSGLGAELGEIEALAEAAADDGPVSLSVEVAVPQPLPGQVILLATYLVLHPYVARHRQPQYIVSDGRLHAYRIELPTGTVGVASFELKASADATHGESLSLEGLVRAVTLVSASGARPYRPGELICCPLLPCPFVATVPQPAPRMTRGQPTPSAGGRRLARSRRDSAP